MKKIYETIKFFFWLTKSRISRKIKTLPKVIDSGDLCTIDYKVYVHHTHGLIWQTKGGTSIIRGANEFSLQDKREMRISDDKIVLAFTGKTFIDAE